ncbi:putative trans-acting enoyl reductase, partial [Diplonema papillatum]
PFNLHGTPVVKYCVNYGTHYADITGEVTWVRETIDRFDTIAKETGSRIVHCCGHDCVPWDLMVMLAAKKLKSEFGSDLEKIEMYDRLVSAPSGGTLATVFSLVYAESKYEPSVSYNPMIMTHKHEKGWAHTAFTGLKSVAYSSVEKAWTTMFVMARANLEVVRRSNALNNYGEKLSYYEAQVHSSMPVALMHFFRVLTFGAIIACPPILALMQKYVLPQPGSGSSAKAMDNGWLEVSCHAQGTKKDAHVHGKLYFKTDPGYRDTARMLVEAGLTLALTEPAKLPG